MKPIQLILVPVLLFLCILFARKLKSQPFLRALVVLAFLSAIVFTVFLDSSTALAKSVGIGRGVDLVMYVSILVLSVSCLLLYLRTLRLERMLTELVRRQSIQEVEEEPEKKVSV